jgi:mono/diheme cytochrome c family protein
LFFILQYKRADYLLFLTYVILFDLMNMDFCRRTIIVMYRIMIIMLALGMLRVAAFAQTSGWVAPESAVNTKNPLAGNTTVLKHASAIYTRHCAPCHGYQGRGDGPASVVLNPKPADHTSQGLQNETDGALYWKLSTGRGQMQPYANILTDSQRWGLINYIRTLKRPETTANK